MRILHLDPDDMDNPLSGGGPVRTFEICRRLAQRHEITVLTPTFPGSTPEMTREGIRYVRLGRKIRHHGSSHHITFFFSLPWAIRKYNYDLLIEDFMPPCSATLNPLFRKTPMIASVQWFFANVLAEQFKLPFHYGERMLVPLYKNFIVLTESMKERLQAMQPKGQFEVIPNGIEESLFSVPIEVGDFIFYIGRVDFAQKGVDLLLRAYAQVSPAERLPLKIAGHAYELPKCQALVHELGLTPWVEFLGKVDKEKREALLRGCRFSCVPSREETFGMVITESLAAGKPVVLFDQPPMNEVADPSSCFRAKPFSVEEFSEGIKFFTRKSNDELLQLGRQARFWAEQYRWDALAKKQEDFYLRVFEEKRK